MFDFTDDEYEPDDDDEEYYGRDDEFDIECLCIVDGCLNESHGDACGCCGGPMCGMHNETLAGFCLACTSAPDFNARMNEITGNVDASFFPFYLP